MPMIKVSSHILAIGLPVAVTQTSTVNGLGPGAPARGITVSVSNPGPGAATVAQVTASISSVSPLAGNSCSAADYVLANPVMTNGAADLAPSTAATFSGATIGFNNTAANQDGCKGATVNLAYAAS